MSIRSRPGHTQYVEVGDYIHTSPADWPCGDNNVSTSRAPDFGAGEAHGDYGTVYVVESIATDPVLLVGSETLADFTDVVGQIGYVIYTSIHPVSVSLQEGDGASLGFPGGGAAGTQVTIASELKTSDFLSWGNLFMVADADLDYAVEVHEWWIQTSLPVHDQEFGSTDRLFIR